MTYLNAQHSIPAFEIRRANVTDARSIAELFLIASDGLAAYVWTRDKAEPASDVHTLDLGARRFARTETAFSYQNCHVATVDGRIVAMIHAFRMPESDGIPETDPVLKPYSELECPGSLYVSGLALLEPWRGQGMGSALLMVAERQAAKYGRLSLICFEENTRAMRLYRKRGYHEIARRPLMPHPSLKYYEGNAVLLSMPIERGR